MNQISKKVCIVGQFGVGKTSLLRMFVSSIFSEDYISTIGVNIEKKTVLLDDYTINMIIWDIAGESSVTIINPSYLKGAHAIFFVVDLTRPESFLNIEQNIESLNQRTNNCPIKVLFNKSDLFSHEEIQERISKTTIADYIITSAKTGANVESAFNSFARLFIDQVEGA